jgi:hypothetical protein
VIVSRKGLKTLAVLLAGLTLAASAQSRNDEKNTYTDPKLEIFNVQIVGPSGVVGESTKSHSFIPRTVVFPNRKFLNPNEQNGTDPEALKISGGFFFDYEFPGDVDFSRHGEKRIVKSTDNLWTVASATKDEHVTIHQQLAAIFRKNLRCFPKGKLQFLNGCLLDLPTVEQARAEDQKIGNQLNKQGGVALSEYTYALNTCIYGVCRQQQLKKESAAASDEKKPETEHKIELETASSGGVEYYKPEKTSTSKDQISETLAPSATINLVDNTAVEQEEVQNDGGYSRDENSRGSRRQNPEPPVSDNVVAKGSSLTFSSRDQTVRATNKKGEVLSEVVQNYDEQLERLKQKLNQSSESSRGGSAETQRELQALRAELSELKQLMRENATRPIEIRQLESKSETSVLEYILITILLVICGAGGFWWFYKTMVLDKIVEDRPNDLLDDYEEKPRRRRQEVKKQREPSDVDSAASVKTEVRESADGQDAGLEDDDDDQSLLIVNQIGEDNTEQVIAEARAKIEDQQRKQEDIVNKNENIVDSMMFGQNSTVESVDVFDTELVQQDFSSHTVEKVDLSKVDGHQ